MDLIVKVLLTFFVFFQCYESKAKAICSPGNTWAVVSLPNPLKPSFTFDVSTLFGFTLVSII